MQLEKGKCARGLEDGEMRIMEGTDQIREGFEFHSISQETEIKTTIPFTNASQRKKYLHINSTKEVNDLFSENCKKLVKEKT